MKFICIFHIYTFLFHAFFIILYIYFHFSLSLLLLNILEYFYYIPTYFPQLFVVYHKMQNTF